MSTRAAVLVLCCVAALSNSACSLLVIKRPPYEPQDNCTRSVAAPIADVGLALLGGAVAVYSGIEAGKDLVGNEWGFARWPSGRRMPTTMSWPVALGVAAGGALLMGTSVGSAWAGFSRTSQCRDVHRYTGPLTEAKPNQ